MNNLHAYDLHSTQTTPAPGERMAKTPDGRWIWFTQLREVLPQRWREHAAIEVGEKQVEEQIETMDLDLHRLACHLDREAPDRLSGHLRLDFTDQWPAFDVLNKSWRLHVEIVLRDGWQTQILLDADHHCRHVDTGSRVRCDRADRWLRAINTEQRVADNRLPVPAQSNAHPRDAIIGHQCSSACFRIDHQNAAVSEWMHGVGTWLPRAKIHTVNELRSAIASHNAAYHPDEDRRGE